MKTILVTGGFGYIGSHTCLELLKRGENLLIVDSLENSSIDVQDKINHLISKNNNKKKGKLIFREGDIRNEIWLKKIFEEFKIAKNPIKTVFHFAGLKSVEESTHIPLKYWDFNVRGTINLLNIMRENNCFNLIFSSSAMIYKQNSSQKFKEDSELNPANPYAYTKYTIEKILDNLHKSEPSKWRIANLRYFNPAGAHPSGLIGDNPKGKPANLFPAIIHTLKNEKNELSIFGNNWPTKDGTCIRDFIHVSDISKLHLLSLKKLINTRKSEIYNCGYGKGYSVYQVVKKFEKLINHKIKINFLSRRSGDIEQLYSDNNKIKKSLNFKVPRNNLENIIKSSIEWEKIIN